MTEELDKTLQEFLAQQSEDKRRGFTIKDLILQVHEFVRIQTRHGREIETLKENDEALERRTDEHADRLDEHRSAIVHIKRRMSGTVPRDSQPDFDADLNTGSFDVATIQRKLHEQERNVAEDTRWWKRTIIMWVAGALGAIALTTVTILITMAISGRK